MTKTNLEKPACKLKAKDFIPIYGFMEYINKNGSGDKNIKNAFRYTIGVTTLIFYNAILVAGSITGLEQIVK